MSNHSSGGYSRSHSSHGSHSGSSFGSDFSTGMATGIRSGSPGSIAGAALHDNDGLFDKNTSNPTNNSITGNLIPGTAGNPLTDILSTALILKLQKNTMFCKHCGINISRDSKFCKKCGKKQ